MMADSFESVATDPSEIINLNLAHSIMGADMLRRKTGFTKGQVMVAFYGNGLDKDPKIAKFHAQMKKGLTHMLFNLGTQIETALQKEIKGLVTKKHLGVNFENSPIMSFEHYCALGTIAIKYATLKSYQDEKGWNSQRRKLIRRKKEQKWAETVISNEYAQFIVAQTVTESNYFDEALQRCYIALEISNDQAE